MQFVYKPKGYVLGFESLPHVSMSLEHFFSMERTNTREDKEILLQKSESSPLLADTS
jgi:hypothetical protein